MTKDEILEFYRPIFLKYYDEDDTNQDQLREIFEWFNSLDEDQLTAIELEIFTQDTPKYILRIISGPVIMSKYITAKLSYIMWKF